MELLEDVKVFFFENHDHLELTLNAAYNTI